MADGILTPCNVAGGSWMTCHWIRPNVRHIGILLVSISTTSPQSTCHSAPVCEILSKSDHPGRNNDFMSIFKMADVSHLGFLGSNNGFFEKPNYITSYRSSIDAKSRHSSKLLSFWENHVFLHFGDRQTNKQTDEQMVQHRCIKPLSLSRAAT